MEDNTYLFEDVMDDVIVNGATFVGGEHVKISRVLSHYVMDIPVYKLVVSDRFGNNQDVSSLEAFDLYTYMSSTCHRCNNCGNFSRKYVWHVIEGCKTGAEEHSFCSLKCLKEYMNSATGVQYTIRLLDNDLCGDHVLDLEIYQNMMKSVLWEIKKYFPEEYWKVEKDDLRSVITIEKESSSI